MSGVSVVTGVGETAPTVVTVMCDFSLSKKRNFACVENQEDMNYEETPVKAPPWPTRSMMTPLPQQSSFSSMEEGSPWSVQERTAIARMEQYVNNSECLKLEIAEVEEFFSSLQLYVRIRSDEKVSRKLFT